MDDSRNPYAPPLAPVADPIEEPQPDTSNRFIPGGRRVPALRGARWIADAGHLFRKRPGRWLAVSILVLLIYLVVGRIPVVNAGAMLIWPFVSGGVVSAADLQRRTGTFTAEALLAGFRKPAPLLIIGGIALLTTVAQYSSYAIVVGTEAANYIVLKMRVAHDVVRLKPTDVLSATALGALMTLPIAAATYMAVPLIVLRKLSAGSAVRMSLTGSVKNILPALVMVACMALMLMMSVMLLGLGLLVSIPVLLIMPYVAYSDIYTDSTSVSS